MEDEGFVAFTDGCTHVIKVRTLIDMNISQCFLLGILFSLLATVPGCKKKYSHDLSGVWTGREQDGTQAGELVFEKGHRMKYSFEGVAMEGQYTIDSSTNPNVLVWNLDKHPGKKAYALIELKENGEIRMSHLSEFYSADLFKQDIVTFTHK